MTSKKFINLFCLYAVIIIIGIQIGAIAQKYIPVSWLNLSIIGVLVVPINLVRHYATNGKTAIYTEEEYDQITGKIFEFEDEK